MDMHNELKQCPFCGGEGSLTIQGSLVFVRCLSCHTAGPPMEPYGFTDLDEQKQAAIIAWNERSEDVNDG